MHLTLQQGRYIQTIQDAGGEERGKERERERKDMKTVYELL